MARRPRSPRTAGAQGSPRGAQASALTQPSTVTVFRVEKKTMQPDLGRLSTAAHHGVRHALGHVLHPQSPGAPRRRSTPRDRLGPQHPHAPRPSADSRPRPPETPVLCCTRTAPHHTPCTAHTSHAPYSSTYSTCMTHTTHTRPALLLHTWHARGSRTTLLHTRHTHQTRTAPSQVAHTTHCALSPLCSSSVRPQSHSAHLTPQGARGSGRGSCRRASQDGSWTRPGPVSTPGRAEEPLTATAAQASSWPADFQDAGSGHSRPILPRVCCVGTSFRAGCSARRPWPPLGPRLRPDTCAQNSRGVPTPDRVLVGDLLRFHVLTRQTLSVLPHPEPPPATKQPRHTQLLKQRDPSLCVDVLPGRGRTAPTQASRVKSGSGYVHNRWDKKHMH